MVDYETMQVFHRLYFGENISEYSIKNRVGKMTGAQVKEQFENHPRYKELVSQAAKSQTGFSQHLPNQLREVIKLKEQL